MTVERDQDDFYDEDLDNDETEEVDEEEVVPLGRDTTEIKPLNFSRDERYRGSLRDRGDWEDPSLAEFVIEEPNYEEDEDDVE